MERTIKISVRDGHEYGEFFVCEQQPFKRETGGWQASATWTCYSSYGTFGHYWSSMGEPFGEFIKGIEEDYLVGKIGTKRLDVQKMVKGIRQLIRERRKAKAIDREQAREALDALDALVSEHDGDVLCHEIYMCPEICSTGIDLCDVETQSWDGQALHFVRRLWPKFVEAFNAQAPQWELETAGAVPYGQ